MSRLSNFCLAAQTFPLVNDVIAFKGWVGVATFPPIFLIIRSHRPKTTGLSILCNTALNYPYQKSYERI